MRMWASLQDGGSAFGNLGFEGLRVWGVGFSGKAVWMQRLLVGVQGLCMISGALGAAFPGADLESGSSFASPQIYRSSYRLGGRGASEGVNMRTLCRGLCREYVGTCACACIP